VSDLTPSSYRPLFRIDPGWPFVLAGLALLIAGVLIPAQRELHELRGQQKLVEADEIRLYARLEAYDRFLNDLRASDPDLVRRLAIAQLNMVPKGEQSLLLTPGLNQTVAQWIDESVPPVAIEPEPYPDTLLGRLALGPKRLWLLAAAAFLLFVGLLIGPDPVRPLGERVRGGFREGDEEGGNGSASDAIGQSARAEHAGGGVARGAVAGAAVGVAAGTVLESAADSAAGGLPLSMGSAADDDSEREGDGIATFASEARIASEGSDASIIDVEIVDDAIELEETTEETVDEELDNDLDAEADAETQLEDELEDELDADSDDADAIGEEIGDEDDLDDEPSSKP
jgi:hypothetical protein